MKSEMGQLSDRFAEVEGHYDPTTDYRRLVAFMLECLRLLDSDRVPQVAADAISVAQAFWKGDATEESLERARAACWNHLEAHGYGSDVGDPTASVIRATICALYSKPPSEDVVELLEWFTSLVNRVQDLSTQENSLLKEHFPALR